MEITYRKLTEADLPNFIQMRINQLQEEGANPTVDLTPNLHPYYQQHLKDGTFFLTWQQIKIKLLEPADCQLLKNRRITAIKIGLLSSVCIPIKITAVWVSQTNFC